MEETPSVKPGARLRSAVCSTELVVVKAPPGALALTIGGAPPAGGGTTGPGPRTVAEGHGGGTALGKRYVDESGALELLCAKAGEGVPALDGTPLRLREAKPLPSSD